MWSLPRHLGAWSGLAGGLLPIWEEFTQLPARGALAMQDTYSDPLDDDRHAGSRRDKESVRGHSRLMAAAIHLGISLLIGVAAFLVVHFIWYPNPYWQMSGGRSLFFLVVSVDIVIGPLITLAIFNPKKSKRALAFDLVIIGVLQIAALSYGIWTIAAARPLFAVFNVDRISVITASDLRNADMAAAERPEFKSLPWFGPRLIAVRRAKSPVESNERITSAMAGRDVPLMPKYYIPYEEAHDEILRHVQPLNTLEDKNPQNRNAVKEAIAHIGRDIGELGYLPTVARGDWVAIIDTKTAAVIEFLPFNGF
jgi:hypothetical protein